MPPLNAIDYPIAIDAGLGALAQEPVYATHVEHLMRQVLFVSPGERINRPDFGCGVRRMVFAANSPVTASLAQVTVYQALQRWLGSVIEVQQVSVTANDATMEIRIAYLLRARRERRYLNLEIAL